MNQQPAPAVTYARHDDAERVGGGDDGAGGCAAADRRLTKTRPTAVVGVTQTHSPPFRVQPDVVGRRIRTIDKLL